MKKLVVFAAALLAAAVNAAYKDGTYTGEGKGKWSTIKVEVTVKGGSVTDVNITEQKETPAKIKAAQGAVVPAVIKGNGTNGVATVSGATFSSKGIIAAVDQALAKAR